MRRVDDDGGSNYDFDNNSVLGGIRNKSIVSSKSYFLFYLNNYRGEQLKKVISDISTDSYGEILFNL
jgi:hypothetical protein